MLPLIKEFTRDGGIFLRKPNRKIQVSLTQTDRMLLDSYCSLATCLGSYLGVAYEIVVHSFGDGEKFTLKIVNGTLSGRTADDKIPETAFTAIEQLQIRQKHGDPIISSNFGVRPDGKKYKSASIGIVGSEGKLIGMICFNYWLDVPFAEVIKSFALPTYLDAAALPLQMSDSGRYDTAIKQEILKVKDAVMNDPEIPAKFKRKEIVRRLNDASVFKVKNAIQICADTLDITIATIYMHIRNLDSN